MYMQRGCLQPCELLLGRFAPWKSASLGHAAWPCNSGKIILINRNFWLRPHFINLHYPLLCPPWAGESFCCVDGEGVCAAISAHPSAPCGASRVAKAETHSKDPRKIPWSMCEKTWNDDIDAGRNIDFQQNCLVNKFLVKACFVAWLLLTRPRIKAVACQLNMPYWEPKICALAMEPIILRVWKHSRRFTDWRHSYS